MGSTYLLPLEHVRVRLASVFDVVGYWSFFSKIGVPLSYQKSILSTFAAIRNSNLALIPTVVVKTNHRSHTQNDEDLCGLDNDAYVHEEK